MASTLNKAYRSALTKNDLISADTACTAGLYNKLGEYVIPAGVQLAIGFGPNGSQEGAQGRIYIKLQTSAPAEITGTVRLSIWTPQNRVIAVVDEWRTEALSASTDRTKQIPLPFNMMWLTEDKKYVLEFNPDSTATVSKTNSTVTIDTTRREV